MLYNEGQSEMMPEKSGEVELDLQVIWIWKEDNNFFLAIDCSIIDVHLIGNAGSLRAKDEPESFSLFKVWLNGTPSDET